MEEIFQGVLIPFLGTSLGAACVFPMKEQLGTNVQRILTGFAAGVMTAASVSHIELFVTCQIAAFVKLHKQEGTFLSSLTNDKRG